MVSLTQIRRCPAFVKSAIRTLKSARGSMSFQSVIGPSWSGMSNIRHLVIFGDSYSSIGYIASMRPSADEPLGVPFPGVTFTEPDAPNWVGHLVQKYSNGPLLVYDYAVGGHTVTGVARQVREVFMPNVGSKPSWAPWLPSDTLFVTWVGINDCAFTNETRTKSSIKQLFAEQELLYQAGARNFLFIDIPPMHRSPSARAKQSHPDDKPVANVTWNAHLAVAIARFVHVHTDITALLFSSWDTFTRVLDDPAAHGLSADDIWADHVHPTSAMHEWVARDLADFLARQKSFQEMDK